jgi:hypothetical protein
MSMTAAEKLSFTAFAGLDLLSSAVILLDGGLVIQYLNPAAENLFAISARQMLHRPLAQLLGEPPGLAAALDNALANNWSYTGQNLTVHRHGAEPLHLDCTVTPVEAGRTRLLLEFRPIDTAVEDGARGAPGRTAAGQPRADPQPRPRDQESARRHPRLGAAARARARPARNCTNTPRSSSRRPTACRS